jgi:uncharacterized cupredoxin-like copper-binding protein
VEKLARPRVGPALAGAATCALALGCASSGQPASSAGQLVQVREADFAITATHRLTAGDVVFQVHNEGPDQHELIISRAPSARLPLRSDGVTADEESLGQAEVGSLEPAKAGAVRKLKVHFAPGRYVLFCNMTGHYMGGMRSTLVVTQ